VSAVVSAPEEAARIAALHWLLNGSSGLLLARPPDPSVDLEEIITDAVGRIREQGVTGQSVTPAVLSLVHELSGGRSVEVNRRLIADNAGLAAEVAAAHAREVADGL
jgi:pseudouridine-5'-phosphate glycosidase